MCCQLYVLFPLGLIGGRTSPSYILFGVDCDGRFDVDDRVNVINICGTCAGRECYVVGAMGNVIYAGVKVEISIVRNWRDITPDEWMLRHRNMDSSHCQTRRYPRPS